MIGNSSNANACASATARYGGKIAVEGGPYRSIKDRRTVFGAENDMDENTRKRLRHAEEDKSGPQPWEMILVSPRQPRPMAWAGINHHAPLVLASG